MRRKLVAANWKMNANLAANEVLVKGVLASGPFACDVSFLAPAPYLGQLQGLLAATPYRWGGQDLSAEVSGAFTGEVAASMLGDFNCQQVIVGHSERRVMHAESDELVVRKAKAALGAGIQPIFCIGESLAERDAGGLEAVLSRQLQAAIDGLGAGLVSRVVIAYEPVWAIGTGRAATPEQVQEVHGFIRNFLVKNAVDREISVIYGGSVKPDNAAALFALPDVDGALVGGASLVKDDFVAICRAAAV